MLTVFEAHIIPRIENIPYIFVDPIEGVGKTVIGVAASALLVVARAFAIDSGRAAIEKKVCMLNASSGILYQPFERLMKVINPNCRSDDVSSGWIREKIAIPISAKALEKAGDNNSLFNKHFVSRLECN